MSVAMSTSTLGKSSDHHAAAGIDFSDNTMDSKDSSIATTRTSTSMSTRVRVSHMLAHDESNNHRVGDPTLLETSSQFQTRKKLKNISVEKLKFHRNGTVLFGREQETKRLNSIFHEVCCADTVTSTSTTTTTTTTTTAPPPPTTTTPQQGKKDRSFTIIGGLSGTGKSALANSVKPLVQAKHGFYALGKFDAAEREPLSAISQAIGSILDQVMALSDKTLLQDIRFQILDQLGSELPLLARIMPKILKLEAEEEDARSYYPPMLDDFKEATDHFNYAIRKFLQIITTFCPIVMVFDDLQWSDAESINLIKTLITDAETKKLMIIGCYRSNFVVVDDNNSAHALSKLYTDVESYAVERHIHVHSMQLDTLSVDHVSLFLSDLLSTDPHKTDGLAHIVLKKTGANMITMQQFLISLTKQELLRYNVGINAWIWEDAQIQAESVATEDVAHLMKDRLKEFEVAAKILPVAACLGSTFSLRLLSVIMEHNNDDDDDEVLVDLLDPRTAGGGGGRPKKRTTSGGRKSSSSEFISKAFSMVSNSLIDEVFICEEEGFIEDRNFANYAFVHDKVQEAALALLPEEEEGVVQFHIGEILWKHLEAAEVEKHLFEIVGLLNSRLDLIPQDFESKLKLARLHYRAGRKAVQISAFRSASFFFAETMKLVPEETWQQDLLFCIDLYASAAETAYCLGNFDDVVEYANRVIPLTTCKPVDKLRLYVVLIETYSACQKDLMALDVGIDILNQLGCKFPRTKFATITQTIKGLLKTKRSVKKITPQFIDNLPVTEDPVHIGIMKILGSLMYPAYAAKPELIPIVCLLANKTTLKHGITPYAPTSFSFLAYILSHFLGDFEGGKVYGEQCLRLLEQHNCKAVEARAIFMYHSGCSHWTSSLQSIMPQYVRVYELAMRSGQSEDGLLAIYYYLEASMYSGRDLSSIENDLANYMIQMVDFKQAKPLFFSQCLLQSIRNLRGKSANTSVLTGGVMNEEENMKRCSEKNDKLMLASMYRRKMFLACHFSEHHVNAVLGFTQGDFTFEILVGQTSIPVLAFLLSVSSFAMARHSKYAKYKNQALKYRKMIQKWSSHNPQCVPYLKVLDAEKAALDRKTDAALAMYKEAVIMTGRNGAIHDQALINERMAELYLDISEPSEAKYRFENAIQLYTEWKAHKKVRMLEMRMQQLFPQEEAIKKH